MILYKTGEITVRNIEKEDERLLVKWLSDPVVLEYYEGRDNPHDLEMVQAHFYGDDGEARCIFEYNEKPIGYVQFYQLDEEGIREYEVASSTTDEKIYGMDQFIGESEYWNKGIGEKLVKSMIQHLINHEKTDRIVMDPQTWNLRAIACYEKCGFKKVKVLKEHEKHEGVLRDCWLIEYTK